MIVYLIYKKVLSLLDNFLEPKMLLHFSFLIFCCLFIFLENDRVSYL